MNQTTDRNYLVEKIEEQTGEHITFGYAFCLFDSLDKTSCACFCVPLPNNQNGRKKFRELADHTTREFACMEEFRKKRFYKRTKEFPPSTAGTTVRVIDYNQCMSLRNVDLEGVES